MSIDILHCGVCRPDIHQVRGGWGGSIYPMVPGHWKRLRGHFDFIIDTVAAPHDCNASLSLLKVDGTMVLPGVPGQPAPLTDGSLIMRRRKLTGGIRETREMLDFRAGHGIAAGWR